MTIPKTLSVVLLGGFLLALPGEAFCAGAGTEADRLRAESGHDLAMRWCASCHVVDMARPGTDAVPTFEAIAARPGVSPERLKGFLLEPHGEMPDFQLSFPHLDAIISYILSLRP